ncbi:hypothetical protein, partial [Planktothrix sp.]
KPLLWHSAQHLDNLSPDIIYQGEQRLELSEHKKERQEIVNKIDEVISCNEGVCKSPQATIYYTFSNFVVKSIPEERDGYGRLAPILSYGNFPDEKTSLDTESTWVQEVSNEIMKFSRSIQLTLSKDAQEMIEKLLREAIENMRQKKIQKDLWKELQAFLLTFGIAIVAPIILGGIIHEQIPQILQPLTQQNLGQQTPITNLQSILQTLVLWLMGFVTVNNVILVLSLKMPSLLMIHRYFKMRKIMAYEPKVYKR